MDDAKVKAIMEWPAPTTVHGVCSFLSLANFYHRFIKDYAKLAKPLTDLTQKDKVFSWGTAEAEAFAELKHRFTTAPILVTHSVAKVFQGSAKTRQAILTKRPTSFWA